MAAKQTTKKKHTTARKATVAKRGKRHVYVAPPAPKPKKKASLADPYFVAATARAKALMAQWDKAA